MAREPWATPEQDTFLCSYLERYREAQKIGSYVKFWPKLYEKWEEHFPTIEEKFPGRELSELSEEEQGVLKKAIQGYRNQLQTWYRWKCNKRARTAEQKQTTLEKELLTPRTRIPQKTEIYSKLCYEDKIKSVANTRCKEQQAKSRGAKLAIIKEVTRELLEKEVPEVKAQVEAAWTEIQAKRDTASTSDRTADDYSRAIAECPALLGHFLKGLAEKTGWAFTVLMGGPDPHADGGICVASYHVGESTAGHTFGESHSQFDTTYIEPYGEFLRCIYPSCATRTKSEPRGTVSSGGEESRHNSNIIQSTRLLISDGARSSPLTTHAPHHAEDTLLNISNASVPVLVTPTVSDASVDAPPNCHATSTTNAPGSSNAHVEATTCALTTAATLPIPMAFPLALPLHIEATTGALLATVTAPIPSAFPACPTAIPTAFPSAPPMIPFLDMGVDTRAIDNDVTMDMSLLGFGMMDFFPGADWFTLPSLASEFTENSSNTSLMAELNDDLLPRPIPDSIAGDLSFLEPTFQLDIPVNHAEGTLQAIMTSTLDQGTLSVSPPAPTSQTELPEVPPRLPTPVAPVVPAPTLDLGTLVVSPLAPTCQSIVLPCLPTPAAPLTLTSRYSGRAIVPSTRAKQMNEIGSTTKSSVTDTSDSNKESNPLGTILTPPQWLLTADVYLTAKDLGSEWAGCVKAWRAFEAHLGYANKKPMLSVNLRPEEWALWIAKGRNGVRAYDQVPTITSPLEFGIAVTKWWHVIQPAFRQTSESAMPLPIYDDPNDANCWEVLHHGGPNGMLSVLTLLAWWGLNHKTASGREEDCEACWVACVVDLRRVLERIISGKKRVGASVATGAVSLKKRKC